MNSVVRWPLVLVLLGAAAVFLPRSGVAATGVGASQSADVSVSVSGPASVVFGQALTFTVTVTNKGPDASDGITLENQFHDVTKSFATTQGTCTESDSIAPVQCSIGTLASGASATVTVTGVAYDGPPFSPTDDATVAAFTPDPDTTNNAAFAAPNLEPALVDFSVAGTADADAVGAGDTVTYAFVVTNNGGVPIGRFGGALDVDLPPGTTVQNADVGGDPYACSPTSSSSLRCGLGFSGTDLTRTVHVAVYFPQVTAPTAVAVTGHVSLGADPSLIVDQNPSNDTASIQTTVSHAETQLTLTGTGPAQAPYTPQPPYPAAHVYTVTNTGPDPAANVTVLIGNRDGLPPTPSEGTCTYVFRTGWQCNLGRLLPAASATIMEPVNDEIGTLTTTAVAHTTTPTSGAAPTATVSTTFFTVPGAPTNVVAVAGNRQATVSFVAPASDGGAAISFYTVTASPGGAVATGNASPITVTGLTNRTHYTFTVTATNLAGTGPASEPSTNPVTPRGVAKPVIHRATIRPGPDAGRAVRVSFKVTRSDTGAPLIAGRMIGTPSVDGKVLKHTEQFKKGTATIHFTIPQTAKGRSLKVRLTIKLGSQSATRVAVFVVK